MILRCPDCNADTKHLVNPWQTAPGAFGALSTLCGRCSRLTVLEIGKGLVLEIDGLLDDEETDDDNTST